MRSMIITKETDYAMRILRVLLDGEKHSVAEMSKTELIPTQFAYQIPVSYTHLDLYKRQGYETAIFSNTIFNCPALDYAIWTYSSPVMTFDNCTFNSSGKVINVYTDFGAGKNDITVNSVSYTHLDTPRIKT